MVEVLIEWFMLCIVLMLAVEAMMVIESSHKRSSRHE